MPERTSKTSAARRSSLWRNRDYLILWSGQTVSVCGSQVSQLAFPLLILALTKSPAQAGAAGVLRMIPYILLSLPAGALVDRWNRKRTMILCDAGRALAVGSIPVALMLGHLSIAQLYFVSLVEGTLMVFFGLSNTAALPQVVGKEQLTAAMGQNDAAYQLGGLLGPLLGGILYGIGRLVPFVLDAVSYAVSVFTLVLIRTRFQEERIVPPRRLVDEIVEGLQWLWGQRLVRTMAFLSTVAWIVLAPANLVVIVLARNQHAPAAAIGLILAVSGVGGIIGSLSVSRVRRHLSFAQAVIGSAWVWTLLWPLYAVAPNPVVLGAITGGLFLMFPLYNVTQMSYRLALIPDQLQGRVNSVFRLLAFAGQPIGFGLAGVLLQALGPQKAVLVLGLAPLGMAVAATLSSSVRHAPSQPASPALYETTDTVRAG